MTAPAEIAGIHHDPGGRYAVVVARFNPEITSGLLDGACQALAEAGVPDNQRVVIRVPGAFEIPLVARTAAASGRYDAVICLGCLIKGDTMHFEYIAEAATAGIAAASEATGVPVSFGVLTTLTDEQALIRSQPGPENKGREAALAAIEMVTLLRSLRGGASL